MKKLFSIILAVMLLMVGSAFAAYDFDLKLARGTGAYGSTKTKETYIGCAGSVTVSSISNDTASMYYQIRKTDGVGASKEVIGKGAGTYTMEYMLDGNDQNLGRTGYDYKIRVAHRSQSSYSGTVAIKGNFVP